MVGCNLQIFLKWTVCFQVKWLVKLGKILQSILTELTEGEDKSPAPICIRMCELNSTLQSSLRSTRQNTLVIIVWQRDWTQLKLKERNRVSERKHIGNSALPLLPDLLLTNYCQSFQSKNVQLFRCHTC